MSCENCTVSFFDSCEMNHSDIVQFLCRHNVFKSVTQCERCGNDLLLNEKTIHFRCHKIVSINKQQKKPCGYIKSARVGSFFHNIRLDLIIYWRIIAVLLYLKPPRQTFIRDNLAVSSNCVVDWYSYCRTVFIYDMERNKDKIGGDNKWIEIGEAIIGCSKELCVFGGIERESNRAFYVSVKERDATALLAVLKNWVECHTTIVSDCWEAFANVDSEGYYNFVDPEYHQHTNMIKKSWQELRSTIPRKGTKIAQFEGYLAEFVFKKRYPPKERLHQFYQTAAKLHLPTN